MLLEAFLTKNSIKLSESCLKLCNSGLNFMRSNRDWDLHGIDHIERMFELLDDFLNSDDKEVFHVDHSVNWEVLLPAICWHDAWRAYQTKGKVSYLVFCHLAESFGAPAFFDRYSKSYSIDLDAVKQIKYAIHYHAGFHFRKPKTIEAKILKDIDSLDLLSLQRVEKILETNGSTIINNKAMMLVVKAYYKINISRIDFEKKFFFRWSKNVAESLIDSYLAQLRSIAGRLGIIL